MSSWAISTSGFPARWVAPSVASSTGPRIRRTHPAPLPLFPLDRIYWDRALQADGFHVHRSRLARVASDHLPIVARLRLPRLVAAPHAG